MKSLAVLATVVLLAAIVTGALAVDPSSVTLNAQDMKLDQAVTELSKQSGVRIFCDTDVKGTVSGSFSAIELEKLLDVMTKPNNLIWQKLYLPDQPDQKLTVGQIKAQADAVAAIADMSMVVYDPATKKQTVFVRQAQDTSAISPEKLGLKPLYFISKPKTAEAKASKTGDAVAKYQQIQQDRMDALKDMTPEQRQQAFQQEIIAQMNMAPAARMQMMKDQHDARNNMDPALRDQYRQMMRDTFREMRDQGMIQGRGDGFGGGDHGGHRNRDRQQQQN